MPATLTEIASELLGLVDSALDRYTDFGPGCPDELREAIRYALLGPGKRFRPLLTLLACRACGGNYEQALPAACAVEMVHAYSLIHDDLPAMDNDDFRRGRPTCHKKFGEPLAILAGDALLARAFEILATELRPAALAQACCAVLAEAAGACALVGGQADDLAAESARSASEPSPTDLEQLESIHRRKTGALICASLKMGGLVAGADPESLKILERYGWCVGLAFQITDDLLDECGCASEVGKGVGKDRKYGKLTYPAVIGLEASRDLAAHLTEEACEVLEGLGPQAEGLKLLARFVLSRKK